MPRLTLTLPIRTVSEANCSEHWHKKAVRHTQQQWAIRLLFATNMPDIKLPCTVKLIRLAHRVLDSDNLQMSMKFIRDELAEILTGTVPKYSRTKKGKLRAIKGHSDSDPRITWQYGQEKSKEMGIRIEISWGET